MRLDLDTEIRYLTGERAGVLRKVVLNSDGDVREVVMATDDLISRNVLVPVDLLVEDAGGGLVLAAGPPRVEELPDYEEALVPTAPEGWEFSDDPAPGGEVFPATMYQPIFPVVEGANVPEGALVLSQGTEVVCLDGRFGILDEVLVDESGRATGFIARPDAPEAHDRVVPLDLVAQADTEQVVLNCTLADLPTYTQETVLEHEEPELD